MRLPDAHEGQQVRDGSGARAGTVGSRVGAVVALFGGLAVYLLILKHWYFAFMINVYAYEGFEGGVSDDLYVSLAPWMLVAGLSLLLSSRIRCPGDTVNWIMAAFVSVPTMLIVSNNPRFSGFAAVALFSLLFGHLMLALANGLRPRPLSVRTWTPRSFERVVMVALALCLGLVLLYYGVPEFRLSLDSAYDIRTELRQADAGRIASYAYTWAGGVLAPALLAWVVSTRRWVLVPVPLLAMALIYSVTGFRAVLLAPLLVASSVAIARLPKRLSPYAGALWFLALTVLVGLAGATANSRFMSLVLERTIFLPGQLSNFYMEYYSQQPRPGWRYGALSLILGGPELSPPEAVGTAYFGPLTNANAGVWMDGFANAGIVGVVISSVALALVVRAANRATCGADVGFAVGAVALPSLYFANTGIVVTMFGGGALLLVVLLTKAPKSPGIPAGTGR